MNELMRWLRDVSICPKCGKSRLYVAVGGRGHGTGQNGVRTASAIYEPFNFKKHCACDLTREADNAHKSQVSRR